MRKFYRREDGYPKIPENGNFKNAEHYESIWQNLVQYEIYSKLL